MLTGEVPRENQFLEPRCFLPNSDPFWDDGIVSGARVFCSDFFLNLETVKFGLMSQFSHVFVDNRRDYQLLIPQTYGQVVAPRAHLWISLAGGSGGTGRNE